jgi:hypothetical protein
MYLRLLFVTALLSSAAQAGQIDLVGPLGSGRFGEQVRALANGNFVVTDPGFDNGALLDVGAVYLYNPNAVLLSTLVGSSAEDSIGSGGIVLLGNGGFVVISPRWDNPATAESEVGAVTWIDAANGLTGAVSASNSLIGAQSGDEIGRNGVIALSTGHYVVSSANWDSALVQDVGAVTWADGSIGIVGEVSASNSLVGVAASDRLGDDAPVLLTNGNYVVRCRGCDNGAITEAGAVIWGDGQLGVRGAVSTSNALLGSSIDDSIGNDQRGVGVYALSNGHYVVASSSWDNAALADVGAVTWCDGSGGCTGVVTTANSLVGSSAGDQVGNFGVTALSNGNYVVSSVEWSDGSQPQMGAATWANGTTGGVGAVSAGNSLIGVSASDRVGSGVVALSNGHFVVASPDWNNGATPDVGAVTWGDGGSALVGVVSAANSLIGASSQDHVGNSVTALNNGNYVVASAQWDNAGIVDAGATTWVSGNASTTSVVSTANSLFGTSTNDRVGGTGVFALSNGNYVVSSFDWDNAGIADVGAATWLNGGSSFGGAVTPANSLIGAVPGDQVGFGGIAALSNGDYVVSSLFLDAGATGDAGAILLADGASGRTGIVSAVNALVGSSADDLIGDAGITELSNGEFVIASAQYDNGAIENAGAITWVRADANPIGPLHAGNSVFGTASGGGSSLNFSYDSAGDRLLVGRPDSNIVTLFAILPDAVFANGFE